jgi:hypothetical protein
MTLRIRVGRPLQVVFVCLVVLTGACDLGRAYRGGVVVNNTRQDLIVDVVGASNVDRVEVPAQASRGFSAFGGECLGTGVAIYGVDGELLTRLDERICDREALRIEEEDLPPP